MGLCQGVNTLEISRDLKILSWSRQFIFKTVRMLCGFVWSSLQLPHPRFCLALSLGLKCAMYLSWICHFTLGCSFIDWLVMYTGFCCKVCSFQQFLCGFPFTNKAGVVQIRFSLLCCPYSWYWMQRVSQGSCESGMVIVECTYVQVEFSMHGKSTRYWRGMCFSISRPL